MWVSNKTTIETRGLWLKMDPDPAFYSDVFRHSVFLT